MEKRRKLKRIPDSNKNVQPDYQLNFDAGGISADDIIAMADTLGLIFNGPISELRTRIEMILHGQKQVWDGHYQ